MSELVQLKLNIGASDGDSTPSEEKRGTPTYRSGGLKKLDKIMLQIDGQEIAAREGMTVLEAAREAGISISTLCHHEKLEPYGACRFCIVELESRGRSRLVVSCLYPAEKDLVTKTSYRFQQLLWSPGR